MITQVYDDLKELEAVYKKLTCSIQQTFNMLNSESVGLKPVIHAKWERHYTRPNVYADLFWHCSNCNFKTMSANADKYYKYCPNCGARMDKEQNNG